MCEDKPIRKVLLQLDPDRHASVFDAVVAIDAGVDDLFTRAGVEPSDVRSLVHGCLFTRGGPDLKNTALFIGGSDVSVAEQLLAAATESFFGPMRVSVMLDANGANTTASAGVIAAERHMELQGATAVVLAGTGPVGQRVARLLATAGANVRLVSRSHEKAMSACVRIRQKLPNATLSPHGVSNTDQLSGVLQGANLVISAGAAGIELLPAPVRLACPTLKVVIDLNAVPPMGIAGVQATDKAAQRDGVIAYGALGVGGTKMRIHKAAIAKLFESNDQVLDAEEIFAIGQAIQAK